MERTKLVPVFLALVLVAASGCLGAGTDDPSNSGPAITSGMDDADVRAAVVSASEALDSYTATIEMTNSAAEYESESNHQVAIDRQTQRARINTSSEMNGETYQGASIIDGTVLYSTDETEANWSRYDRSTSLEWKDVDLLSTFVTLADRSNATVVGSTTVDGEGATILEGDIDAETYASVLARENASRTTTDESNVTGSVRIVVDNETARPRTVQVQTTRASQYGAFESTTTMHVDSHDPGTQIRTPQETVTVTMRTGSGSGTTTVVTASAPPTDEE